jgi:hypothetical protein
MHTQTRVLVAHEPEADHIYCMWCGVRLTIAPHTTPRVKKEAPNSERYYVPAAVMIMGAVRLDWAEKKTNQADCDEINPGWHWLCIEATTEDGAVMLRQIKEATAAGEGIDAPCLTEFRVGDIVEATATIRRKDGRSELRPGDKATVRAVSKTNPDSPQIIDLDIEGGLPMGDIVCFAHVPLRLLHSPYASAKTLRAAKMLADSSGDDQSLDDIIAALCGYGPLMHHSGNQLAAMLVRNILQASAGNEHNAMHQEGGDK